MQIFEERRRVKTISTKSQVDRTHQTPTTTTTAIVYEIELKSANNELVSVHFAQIEQHLESYEQQQQQKSRLECQVELEQHQESNNNNEQCQSTNATCVVEPKKRAEKGFINGPLVVGLFALHFLCQSEHFIDEQRQSATSRQSKRRIAHQTKRVGTAAATT